MQKVLFFYGKYVTTYGKHVKVQITGVHLLSFDCITKGPVKNVINLEQLRLSHIPARHNPTFTEKTREFGKPTYVSFFANSKAFYCVNWQKLWKTLIRNIWFFYSNTYMKIVL